MAPTIVQNAGGTAMLEDANHFWQYKYSDEAKKYPESLISR